MLTVDRRPPPVSQRALARSARFAAVRPTARVSQPWLVFVTVGIASAPLAVTVLRSGDDIALPVVLLCTTAGASLGWTVDDPAAEVLGPLPIDGAFRLRLRLAAATTIAILVLALASAVLEVAGPGLPADAPDRLAESAAAAVTAIAIGLLAVRIGNRAVGPGAVTSGLLLPGAVAALAVRWPSLPTFMTNSAHHRWWWLAAVGGVVAARLATTEPR